MKKVFLKTDGTEKPPTRVIYNRLAAAWRMGIVHPFEFCVNVYSGHDTEIPRVMMDDRDGSVNGRIYYLFDKSLAERKEKVR